MNTRPLAVIGAIIIVIAIIGAAAYALHRPAPTTPVPGNEATSTPQAPVPSAPAVSTSTGPWSLAIPTPASSTVDVSAWKVYVDPANRFSLEYPKDLVVAPGDAGSVAFSFPKNLYFSWPLLDDVKVAAAAGPTCPELVSAGIEGVPATTTTIANGYAFTRSIGTDVGAGNRYLEVLYTTMANGICYSVSFLDHGTNGAGFYVDSASLVERYDAEHDAKLARVLDILGGMMRTYRILAR